MSLLKTENVQMYFPLRGGILTRTKSYVRAVDGVSFTIEKGETFGLVGESGSGKTTIGKVILKIIEPTGGKIYFDGVDITKAKGKQLKQLRARMQMVFQNPYSSLNPRKTVMQILKDPFRIHRHLSNREAEHRVITLLEMVGLSAEHAQRYPYEFSGGQRQRIAIARAIALSPEFIFFDEPTSSLDVSVQAQILKNIVQLQETFGLTCLFVTHNIEVIRCVADRVGVMYLGKLVEMGSTEEVFANPLHPYTKALFSAVPDVDPDVKKERMVLPGEISSAVGDLPACHFFNRCPLAQRGLCDTVEPELRDMGGNHLVACHMVKDGRVGATGAPQGA
jgi:oligopeptide/dipeptide ABC transporter ATP-binding protein